MSQQAPKNRLPVELDVQVRAVGDYSAMVLPRAASELFLQVSTHIPAIATEIIQTLAQRIYQTVVYFTKCTVPRIAISSPVSCAVNNQILASLRKCQGSWDM